MHAQTNKCICIYSDYVHNTHMHKLQVWVGMGDDKEDEDDDQVGLRSKDKVKQGSETWTRVKIC